jgi:hypothetical protein
VCWLRILLLRAGGCTVWLGACLPSPQPLQLLAGRTELSREEEPCWCAWPLYLAHRPMRVHQYAELWDELRIRTRRRRHRRSSIEPKTPAPSKSPRSRPPFLNYGSASDLHCSEMWDRERAAQFFRPELPRRLCGVELACIMLVLTQRAPLAHSPSSPRDEKSKRGKRAPRDLDDCVSAEHLISFPFLRHPTLVKNLCLK